MHTQANFLCYACVCTFVPLKQDRLKFQGLTLGKLHLNVYEEQQIHSS